MAGGLALHYIDRRSPVHDCDPRTKILALLALTLPLLGSHPASFLLSTSAYLALIVVARIPLASVKRTVFGWVPILLILVLFQTVGTGAGLMPSADALIAAGWMVWRLLLFVLLAVLLTSTTTPRELQTAVAAAVHRVPLVPARRVSVMTSLAIHFFSVVLDDLHRIRLANRARGIDAVRSPLARVRSVVVPTLRNSFRRVDTMSLAMLGRGYSDDVPVAVPPWPARDIAWCVGICVSAAVVRLGIG